MYAILLDKSNKSAEYAEAEDYYTEERYPAYDNDSLKATHYLDIMFKETKSAVDSTKVIADLETIGIITKMRVSTPEQDRYVISIPKTEDTENKYLELIESYSVTYKRWDLDENEHLVLDFTGYEHLFIDDTEYKARLTNEFIETYSD